MLEFERDNPIDTEVLAEFFVRCGWRESEAETKLGWVLAASEEWVVCRLDGELIGFGRSWRVDPLKRLVCDVLVDARFQGRGLGQEIVRLLSQNVRGLEEVSVFTEAQAFPLLALTREETDTPAGYLPDAPPGAYLGRQNAMSGGAG